MPYIFPKRALADSDVLDPVDMNADLIPVAEKYSGRLNCHDFSDLSSSVTIAANGYYTPHHTTTTVGHGITHNGATGGPDEVASPLKIENSVAWQAIVSSTYVTAQCSLWITGQLLYAGQTWVNQGGSGLIITEALFAHESTDVQFAISVDGQVLEWTKTGTRNEIDKTFAATHPTAQKTAGAVETSGPVAQREDWARAIGPAIGPVRLTAVVQLEAGEHTIEIVGRRLPPLTGSAFRSITDYVVVYSRRLFGLEVPLHPSTAHTTSVADIPAYAAEDTLDAASIATDRVDVIRTAYNDIDEGALARGALNNNHLPAALTYADQTVIAPVSALTTDATYPGFAGTTTFAANRATGVSGWWRLDEAGSDVRAAPTDPLRVTGSGGGTITTNAGYIVVMGNVEVPTVGPIGETENIFGHVAIGYLENGGSEKVLDDTEAVTHAFNRSRDGATTGSFSNHIDIPIFYVHGPSDGVLPTTLDYFQVYACSADGNGAGAVQMQWQRGNLLMLELRA